MIPKQLVQIINSGRAIALVGSGPSSAMGYPSWGRLAAIARDAVEARTGAGFNKRKYEELMSKELLPELFDQAQNDLGGIERLLAVLRPALVAISGTGRVYQLISKWPFRLYLTTNYDNELVRHLSAIGEHFTTLGNDQAALASINDDSSRLVCKLHGSLESPTGLVLTASQFREFKVQGVRQYFRDKLKAMFSSFAVVVIGHSLTDADLSLVLESAKETSSPERPIYMVLADVSEVEREKYLNEYNIRILSYENPDGKHSELTYMLRVLDRFIVPRTSEPLTLENPDPKEVEIASSLVLFSKLALGQHEADLAQEAIRPQVLALACDAAPNSVRISEIPARLMPEVLAHHPGVSKRVDASIETLTRAGLLVSEAESVKASPLGVEKEAALQLAKRTAEDQVFGALETRLRRDVAGVSSETIRKLRDGLRGSLLAAFRKRGLSAASLLFRSTPLDRSDMPELFEAITRSVADVTDFASRAVFVEFVMGLLAQPNEQQRAYLADMSQGFFAYHLFGLDPAGGKVRASIARETEWVCDSNVFMPLLAIACHSHGFHLDFFARTKALGIRAVTTSRFITETRQALMWAADNSRPSRGGGSVEAAYNVTRQPGYYENLFIDGFIRGAGEGRWKTFQEYSAALQMNSDDAIGHRLLEYGVVRRNLQEYAGYDATEDALELEHLTRAIWDVRVARGISRGGEKQARAEAEALKIIRGLRTGDYKSSIEGVQRSYFVSTSRLLDSMYGGVDGLLTWSPESFYRHLTLLSGDAADATQIFESIMTNYYGFGVELVPTSESYAAYFGPVVAASRLSFQKESQKYLDAMERDVSERETVQEKFDRTPDLEKPLFVEQMGWAIARKEEERRLAAEQRTKMVEAELAQAQRTADEQRASASAQLAETRRKHKEEVLRLRKDNEEKTKRREKQAEATKRHAHDPQMKRKKARQLKKRAQKTRK